MPLRVPKSMGAMPGTGAPNCEERPLQARWSPQEWQRHCWKAVIGARRWMPRLAILATRGMIRFTGAGWFAKHDDRAENFSAPFELSGAPHPFFPGAGSKSARRLGKELNHEETS